MFYIRVGRLKSGSKIRCSAFDGFPLGNVEQAHMESLEQRKSMHPPAAQGVRSRTTQGRNTGYAGVKIMGSHETFSTDVGTLLDRDLPALLRNPKMLG